MLSLFKYLNKEKQLDNLSNLKEVDVSSLEALALLTSLSFNECKRKMFFLFPTIYEAEKFIKFLSDFISEDDIFMFPYDEIFRTSTIGVSQEMNEERLLALSSIYENRPSILVSHVSSSCITFMSKERYNDSLIKIKDTDMVNVTKLVDKISSLGYMRMDHVTNMNQYSIRGGILDIFDASYKTPLRIEFFGDEIDDIRFFKVEDERSYKHIKEIIIHPASLRLLNESEIKEGEYKIKEELNEIEDKVDRLSFDDLKDRCFKLLDKTKHGYLDEIDSRFYSCFNNEENTLLSYLNDYEKFVFDHNEVFNAYSNIIKKEKSYFNEVSKKGNSLKLERVFSSLPLDLTSFISVNISDDFIVRSNSYHAISYIESDELINTYLKENYTVIIILPEPNLSNYKNYLQERNMSYTIYPLHSSLMLIEGKISDGFELPKEKYVYLGAKEIFGASDKKSRFLSRYKEAKIIKKYEDLEVGDYVVHEIHGVGKYQGVINIEGLEYLKIQYSNDQVFYLPLSQYKMIRKYASKDGYAPSLDKMGGSTWARKKSKIRSKISYLADQLLALYSERKTRPGYAFSSDEELENEFKNSFSYPYTKGQEEAINDITLDMESSSPMDRLIAGDVGFGKTEVAFVACFKAVLNHKQVAFLCPTTILSNQHYKVAKSRFSNFGIKIAVLNRFTTASEKEKIITSLKEGSLDIIIGTHALLNDAVVFKDLGLLIIDEEQKFGVAHKEKIKEKTKNIDCLTLTATPIPRTMQMSLLGVRSMSLLSEPPLNRMPVKTYVAKQDNELIYEVIGKELDRKGQVYYLHNKISNINDVANRLQKKFPNFSVGICHAKMDQDEIEDIMNKFYQNEINILVCTSIIESGLDIPNVNTIIVERADCFGLAQLYQIKGRVGRSDRLAYAYFFFDDSSKLTDEGRKRLKALKEFTELGSGYKIAMQDLNIRGAGDILGSEQAGFVNTLGYDAYMDLLEEVIKEKTLVQSAVVKKRNFELMFSLDAHIPEDYSTEKERINMYRELSDCNDDSSLQIFSEKLRDVYGPYPEEVSALLLKKKIENYLNAGDVESFVEGLGFYTIKMTEIYSSIPNIYKKLEDSLKPILIKMRFRIEGHSFVFVLTKTKEYLTDLLYLIVQLIEAKK